MRTSLNNLKLIDDHLNGPASPQDNLLLQAKIIINPDLKHEVQWHKQTLQLVQQYGRKQLRADIEAVHTQLFTLPQHSSFKQGILRFFKR